MINILPDPRFKRRENDLFTTVETDLYTAVLGGKLTVETMKGPVTITVPTGTQNGKTFRLKNLVCRLQPQEEKNRFFSFS